MSFTERYLVREAFEGDNYVDRVRVLSCDECGALVLDDPLERARHEEFHRYLRMLSGAAIPQGSGRGPGL